MSGSANHGRQGAAGLGSAGNAPARQTQTGAGRPQSTRSGFFINNTEINVEPNFSFLLGRIKHPEHEARLLNIAQHLDANKFSCTLSIISGEAMFDVAPHYPESWPSDIDFRLYAAEHIIHTLGKSLA